MRIMGMTPKVWLTVVAMLSLIFVACGEDNGEGEDNQQQNQTNNQNNDQNNDETLELCNDGEDPEFESEYALRFNEFEFLDGSPGHELNELIKSFLDQSRDYPIIVLLELMELDAQAGDVRVRGGAGLHAETEGEYVWDDEVEEPDETDASIDEEGRLQAELGLLNFVATVQTEDDTLKTVIPIRDIELEATIRADEDGSNPCIDDGELQGYVVQEEVEDVRIALQEGASGTRLELVLGEENINADYSGDGEDDAWWMEAEFSAEETVIVEE